MICLFWFIVCSIHPHENIPSSMSVFDIPTIPFWMVKISHFSPWKCPIHIRFLSHWFPKKVPLYRSFSWLVSYWYYILYMRLCVCIYIYICVYGPTVSCVNASGSCENVKSEPVKFYFFDVYHDCGVRIPQLVYSKHYSSPTFVGHIQLRFLPAIGGVAELYRWNYTD